MQSGDWKVEVKLKNSYGTVAEKQIRTGNK